MSYIDKAEARHRVLELLPGNQCRLLSSWKTWSWKACPTPMTGAALPTRLAKLEEANSFLIAAGSVS